MAQFQTWSCYLVKTWRNTLVWKGAWSWCNISTHCTFYSSPSINIKITRLNSEVTVLSGYQRPFPSLAANIYRPAGNNVTVINAPL